jgi:hypothetical protein
VVPVPEAVDPLGEVDDAALSPVDALPDVVPPTPLVELLEPLPLLLEELMPLPVPPDVEPVAPVEPEEGAVAVLDELLPVPDFA